MKPDEMTLEVSVNGKSVIEREESMAYGRNELAFLICMLLGEKGCKTRIKIEIEKNDKQQR